MLPLATGFPLSALPSLWSFCLFSLPWSPVFSISLTVLSPASYISAPASVAPIWSSARVWLDWFECWVAEWSIPIFAPFLRAYGKEQLIYSTTLILFVLSILLFLSYLGNPCFLSRTPTLSCWLPYPSFRCLAALIQFPGELAPTPFRFILFCVVSLKFLCCWLGLLTSSHSLATNCAVLANS